MKKQLIHIQIDANDYLKGKSLDINWSQTGRMLFKQYLSVNENEMDDEITIIKNLGKAQKKAEELNEEVAKLSTELIILRDKKSKDMQTKLDMEIRINTGRKESGSNPLDR